MTVGSLMVFVPRRGNCGHSIIFPRRIGQWPDCRLGFLAMHEDLCRWLLEVWWYLYQGEGTVDTVSVFPDTLVNGQTVSWPLMKTYVDDCWKFDGICTRERVLWTQYQFSQTHWSMVRQCLGHSWRLTQMTVGDLMVFVPTRGNCGHSISFPDALVNGQTVSWPLMKTYT